MGILNIKDLKWSINGSNILNNINMDFKQGIIHSVVGSNGVGKTTLGNVIMGIEGYRDFEGDLIYEGQSIKKLNLYQRAKKGITMSWQEPARFEGLTVEKFISAGARDKSRQNTEDFLKKVGMNPSDYLHRAVDKNLSGGERKKIELASILAIDPKLVILDEPDSGIDVASLQNIFDAMKYLKKNGATIILITHSLEVLKQSEHAFLLCCGSVLKEGTVKKISRYFENKCLPCDHKNQPSKNGESL
ncbi:MAG: ATP-binding cassette domain-containing protein [Actinomycetota bacterium]|nr:ATP-binding cassette domain-containing protein [Actinomycetota bacterium]